PVAAAIFLVREPLITTLYGSRYAAAAPVLALLAPAAVPLAVNMVALSALAAADVMGATAVLYLCAAAMDVALNLAWVPVHGAMGAAAAALVAESGLAAGLACLLVRRSDR
ncbi:MAG TPA: polysaccharide biosynthesis C-terminal domain-containing protein, partial [Longimicrobiaceae bacterium]|nr:polysaccharide biosynthesis C-terminal domain-containing protein [Longimicrobiaceae bacterium]